ncbi:mitochondrial import receptor subunit TOM40 homolog 1-like [Gigantopelta aegis]|uniref:mitochondrial import receptor subunit TOM40 homolog 1-like n=1 Tax=Gigantopelta aegis TaxID=1735272 RepID=UPI001B889423|nr:mitochondrial import receptor subunit TOM40 homolog 1-like [Gigantopelta aegis]
MGNVFAAGAPPVNIPPPPLGAPPPPTEQPATSGSTQTKVEDTRNPGSFEDLHKKCKDIFPQVFEGGKLIVSKGLSSHFQISHTLSLSTFQPSGYRFGATYVGIKQLSPTESFPVIIGDIDPSGNLNANIIHAFTDSIRAKLVAQIQNNKCVATQVTADYKGTDFTSSLTLGNIDIVNESGIAVTQYLQRVTPSLDLGAELLYQYGQQIPGGMVTVLSLAGRYSGENWQLSGNISPLAGSLHSCYVHKITDQLQIGAELETSLRLQESVATIGYQIEVPNANATFRGQLDTNWCIGAVLEKKLPPFPFTLALSGYANHVKGQYRFGVGLIVG